MPYIRGIESTAYLYDFNGNPKGALKDVMDIEREIVFDGVDVLYTRLAKAHNEVVMDEEIIYKNKRYIVTASEDKKSENVDYTEVEASSAQVELSGPRKSVDMEALGVEEGLEILLDGTGWQVGEVELRDNYTHSMNLEDRSVLYLVRNWARLSRHLPEYDTINRVVHFRIDDIQYLDSDFRYGQNTSEIVKIVNRPVATVIWPYGRDGMSIESVNEGKEYLENYSWYESLGVPLEVAREKYKRDYIWEDNRYVYAGYLKADAEERLEVYSQPQVTYEISVAYAGEDIVGKYAYVMDDEWGIKIETRVVKMNLYDLRPWDNKVEFNYLIEGIHDEQEEEPILDVTDDGGEKIVMAKNGSKINLGNNLELMIQLSITAADSFNAQIGFYIIGESEEDTLFTGYFMMGGSRIGPNVRQRLIKGFNTVGLTFILPMIQEGSDNLEFVGMVEEGSLEIDIEDLEVYVKGENLLGAISSKLPRAEVIETVELPNPSHLISMTDEVVDVEEGES